MRLRRAWALTVAVALPALSAAATLSNEHLTVEIDETRGTFSVLDRASGRTWGPDPWTRSAGSLQIGRLLFRAA